MVKPHLDLKSPLPFFLSGHLKIDTLLSAIHLIIHCPPVYVYHTYILIDVNSNSNLTLK